MGPGEGCIEGLWLWGFEMCRAVVLNLVAFERVVPLLRKVVVGGHPMHQANTYLHGPWQMAKYTWVTYVCFLLAIYSICAVTHLYYTPFVSLTPPPSTMRY